MPHPDHVLNITSDPIGVVHLHADRAGLDLLIRRLQGLRDHLDKGECEHDHFMADSWGGCDLSEENGLREDGHVPVYHLKVMAWTDDWAARHGFTKQEAASAGAEVSLPPSAYEYARLARYHLQAKRNGVGRRRGQFWTENPKQ